MRPIYLMAIYVLAFLSGVALAAVTTTVDQRGIAFNTPALTIAKGGIVNFTNSDNTSHNILIVGEGVNLNSGLQGPGVAFKAPFQKPGMYKVSCGIHPKMKMTITVK